jgi:hypothetical protein
MRFWLDCEFIEDGPDWPIELISIGLVAEDGREYVACNQQVNFARLLENPWLVENVLPYLPVEKRYENQPWTVDNVLMTHSPEWKTRRRIAEELIAFCGKEPEIWGYYPSYDWVVLCQLFGRMIDLPDGWPMYPMDVKQWCVQLGNPRLPAQEGSAHNVIDDARHHRVMWEFLDQYRLAARPVP